MDAAKIINTEVTSNTVLITPQIASEWLKFNTMNRAIKPAYAEFLAKVMLAGEFEFNGEPIIISDDGVLLDGQHRLKAIVISEVALPMVVVAGIKVDVFDTIDIGRNRTAQDVLTTYGYSRNDAGILATAGRHELTFNNNTGKFSSGTVSMTLSSPHKVAELINSNEDMVKAFQVIISYPTKNRPIDGGAATWLLYRSRKQNTDLADDYFYKLMTGANLGENDIVLHVRQRLERDLRSIRRMPKMMRVSCVARGWAYTLKGSWPNYEANIWKGIESALSVYADGRSLGLGN